MMRRILVMFAFFLLVKNVHTGTCKKVIVIPGLLQPDFLIQPFVDIINEKKPCTRAEVFSHGNIFKTLFSIWYQADELKSRFMDLMRQNPDGIHIIGESLGGILARSLIQTLPDHNVNTLITLGSPHNGFFDVPILLPYYLPVSFKIIPREILTNIFYTPLVQRFISIANGWKNPTDYDYYLESNDCLPIFNNEKPHPNFEHFRKSFLKLRKFVMVAGEDDRIVIPWESSLFSYYDESLNIVNMTNQKIYEVDSLGLKTMNEAGRIKFCSVPEADHLDLKYNVWALKYCILPHLN